MSLILFLSFFYSFGLTQHGKCLLEAQWFVLFVQMKNVHHHCSYSYITDKDNTEETG